MKPKVIAEGVKWVGVVDWNRRMFDSLIPLPDGTSYNAYLVQGTEKTALIDAVDPAMLGILKEHLKDVCDIFSFSEIFVVMICIRPRVPGKKSSKSNRVTTSISIGF